MCDGLCFDAITQITCLSPLPIPKHHYCRHYLLPRNVCVHTLQPLWIRIVEFKIEHDTLALPCQSLLCRVHAHFSLAPSELHFYCTVVAVRSSNNSNPASDVFESQFQWILCLLNCVDIACRISTLNIVVSTFCHRFFALGCVRIYVFLDEIFICCLFPFRRCEWMVLFLAV